MKIRNIIITVVLVIAIIADLMLWALKIIPVVPASTALLLIGVVAYGFLTFTNYKDNIYGGKFDEHFKEGK